MTHDLIFAIFAISKTPYRSIALGAVGRKVRAAQGNVLPNRKDFCVKQKAR